MSIRLESFPDSTSNSSLSRQVSPDLSVIQKSNISINETPASMAIFDSQDWTPDALLSNPLWKYSPSTRLKMFALMNQLLQSWLWLGVLSLPPYSSVSGVINSKCSNCITSIFSCYQTFSHMLEIRMAVSLTYWATVLLDGSICVKFTLDLFLVLVWGSLSSLLFKSITSSSSHSMTSHFCWNNSLFAIYARTLPDFLASIPNLLSRSTKNSQILGSSER